MSVSETALDRLQRRAKRPAREKGPQWAMLTLTRGPDSIEAWARRYLEALAVLGLSPQTVYSRYAGLAVFTRWCAGRELVTPHEITKPILERYQHHLFYARKADGEPLSAQRQALLIVYVKGFFKWLAKHNHLLHNPASEIELPKLPRRSLREPLNLTEVERVLGVPDLSTPLGLRDRAMLEVLYSTGLRRQELTHLLLHDIDPERGTVFVRQGKGKKDRIVPIGERALAWLRKYLDEVRPHLAPNPGIGALFLTIDGQVPSASWLTGQVRRYYHQAGVTKAGSCHLLRHTMATQMLENGADVRFIQEMLGHESLETTQRYTHVTITQLKLIHAATHPGAKLERKSRDETPLA